MIRFQSPASFSAARHDGDELSAAWEHLMAAAEHGARQVRDASRRHGLTARERAAAAALALRGRQQPSWQWLAAGLAAGVVVGAVAATTLRRRMPPPEQARQRAGAAVTAARARFGEAAQTAAATARNRAEQVRDRFGRTAEEPDRLPEPEVTPTPATRPSLQTPDDPPGKA